jgi:hypothetical protein
MARTYLTVFLGAFAWGAFTSQASAQVTYDRNWSYNQQKDYYYKKATFPKGGYQYIIFYKAKPEFIYWFNPAANNGDGLCWCCCPTVKNPVYGARVQMMEDLFLMAEQKAKDPKDTKFPAANDANFQKGKAKAKAKDSDGSEVTLDCPPLDLP